MTDHPIIPPPELLQQWATDYWGNPGESIGEGEKYIATQAARWGADTELEACVEWLAQNCGRWELSSALRAARRPKPPSLAQRALHILGEYGDLSPKEHDTIRKALEKLND